MENSQPQSRIIQSNDRVFVCGKTGSGKTVLAKYLTAKLSRLIVLDPKGSLDNWDCLEPNERNIKKFLNGEPLRLRFVPPLTDAADYWQLPVELAFNAGDCVIYVDELYGVVPPGQRAGEMFSALWTRGREFGIGAWGASQRPSWVPLVCISEADHHFVFRLTLDEDRARMAAFMGDAVMQPITDRHGFWQMSQVDDVPVYNPGLKI